MNRLESLSADLTAKLRRSSIAKQRAAGLAASELAVFKAEIAHPLIDEAIQQLRAGHVFTLQEKGELDALTARLDEEYFDLQDAAEAGQATTDDYLRAFAKARAVAALSFAGSDAPDAVADSIYEAAAAVGDDKSEFLSLIESALK